MPNCDKCRRPLRAARKSNMIHTRCGQCRAYKAKRQRWYDKKVATKNAAKGNCCASCGFIAAVPMQLDIDHIDGNHNNNDPSNLQTLCANCHRLKTWNNRDWKRKGEVETSPFQNESTNS